MEQRGSHWTHFYDMWYFAIFRKCVEKIEFSFQWYQHDKGKFVLLILLSLLYMFRATDRWHSLCHRDCVTGRQQTAQSVLCSEKLYIQSKCSRRWAKLSRETCRESLKESVIQILLHLVDCWYHCTSDARSHKRLVSLQYDNKAGALHEVLCTFIIIIIIIIIISWRYSPGWALASATICLQVSRSVALSLHSFIPIFLRSMDTSSSHLILRWITWDIMINVRLLNAKE